MTSIHMDAEGNILGLRIDVTEVATELKRQLEHWQQAAQQAHKQWEESDWYLGEARAACAHLEEQLEALRRAYGELDAHRRDVLARLEEAERQRNDINWSLSGLTAEREGLWHKTTLLSQQLARTQTELAEARGVNEELERLLGAERARHVGIEAQFNAVQTYGERRRALRKYRPDVTAELRADDGTILFRGLPRDVSLTGLGFASDEPIHYLVEPLKVCLRFSESVRPVDILGRLVWQRQETKTAQYLAGCELVDLPSDGYENLEQALSSPVPAPCAEEAAMSASG